MFLDRLCVELVDDTANEGRGEWRLLRRLRFRAKGGTLYTVPINFHCDFASVPRAPLMFWATGDTAHRAAVLHDYLCRTGLVERRLADDLFLEAMLVTGVPEWRANAMHLAVRSYSASLESGDPHA